MRIDPKESIAGQPALLVRQALRRLRVQLQWRLEDLEATTSLEAGKARAFIKTLLAEGLVESTGPGTWTITQAGQSLSSATAAKRVTRATAEKSLQEFSRRVERVNWEPYFLGKVTKVVLFGSMLKPEVERVSDVDLAVEIVEKEADSDLSRIKNYDRVEELGAAGHRFRNVVEMAGCWHLEVFRFLKGRSRVIALADYAAEKGFVLAAPHRFLLGKPDQSAAQNPPSARKRQARRRRSDDCPF
jgi:predicted nucleotidyltransferase